MTSDFAARSRQFQDALYEALAGTDKPARDADVLANSASLWRAPGPSPATASTSPRPGCPRLHRGLPNVEAAVSEAAALFASPQRFREAVYFARCLDRDAAAALELLKARGYLAGAVVPVATYPDLASNQAAVLDATTFAQLWQDRPRLRAMIDTSDLATCVHPRLPGRPRRLQRGGCRHRAGHRRPADSGRASREPESPSQAGCSPHGDRADEVS